MVDDFSSDINTKGTVIVGSSADGNIDSTTDNDWFKISLEAENTYIFNVNGNADGSFYINSIAGSSGIEIHSGLYRSNYSFTPATTGNYFVAVDSSYVGSYTLSASKDDYPGGINTNGSLSLNQNASGEIQYTYDEDWFKANLIGGKKYCFEIKGLSTNNGTLDDPYI